MRSEKIISCSGEKDLKKILFILNPKAGKAKIKNYLLEIIDIFVKAEFEVTVYTTQAVKDAFRMTKERKENYDLIVCSGGDGTLNEVAAGMMQCKIPIPIGYIPAGSTNDFAHSLDIADHMPQAARMIVSGSPFYCDIGQFNTAFFVYIAAFGIFTEVSYATDQQMKNILGHTAYILQGIKSLSSIQSYHIKITCQEVTEEGEYIYGMISNSVYVGGFKNLTGKEVRLDDGKFEVTLIKRPSSALELNNIITSLITRKRVSNCVTCFKTSHLIIESEKQINWTLDGEFGGSHTKVEIRNVAKAIPIIR